MKESDFKMMGGDSVTIPIPHRETAFPVPTRSVTYSIKRGVNGGNNDLIIQEMRGMCVNV